MTGTIPWALALILRVSCFVGVLMPATAHAENRPRSIVDFTMISSPPSRPHSGRHVRPKEDPLQTESPRLRQPGACLACTIICVTLSTFSSPARSWHSRRTSLHILPEFQTALDADVQTPQDPARSHPSQLPPHPH